MLSLGSLAFLQPWLLGALVLLPAVYLLLRITPPSPKRISFPPFAILARLVSKEETPARTPLWLLILRLLAVTLIILGLARPILNPAPEIGGQGPLLVVLDDGWAAAPNWQKRLTTLRGLFEQAERESRELVLLRTAPDQNGVTLDRMPASEGLRQLDDWRAKPWPVDHVAARETILANPLSAASTAWLTDGIGDREGYEADAQALANLLATLGPLTIIADPIESRAVLLDPPEIAGNALEIGVTRPFDRGDSQYDALARGPAGEVLARGTIQIGDGEANGALSLELPLDLRNRIARVELTPEMGVGATALFDERWRRRNVGIVGSANRAATQPLLAEPYFVERAFSPYSEVQFGEISTLLDTPLSLLVITDRGRLDDSDRALLGPWIEDGGVVVRFAGPRLAASSDDLVPVPLRQGDRQLGGALSWSEPLPLAPFPPESPFAGLEPNTDAVINRQVLAEPGPELSDATMASLVDGTPIVTGQQRGDGWLILVHTTANTSWTSLPISGLFVDMLRRLLDLSRGTAGSTEGMLRSDEVLTAEGQLVDPPATSAPVTAERFLSGDVGPDTPPGLYAPASTLAQDDEQARFALNIQLAIDQLLPVTIRDVAAERRSYELAKETDLAKWLLLAALILVLIDLVATYALRGLIHIPRFAALALFLFALPLEAQETTAELIADTRLGYVQTGISSVDENSHAGLFGLARTLMQRTSIDAGEPVAVDIANDELAVYPLLYWPVPPEHPPVAQETIERIGDYLRRGGLILFDTGDAARLFPGQNIVGPGEQRLATLLATLDLPPLTPVPEDHVLTRSFYLLQEFPGRFTGQPVWVDQTQQGVNDGVAGVVIGGHDWAGAWAVDEYGTSLLPVVPGGDQQREIARRFGVNLVMYALTGNYKTDQVHVPALLERLGQ